MTVLLSWIAVACWSALVLTLSGEGFSAPETEGWLAPLLRWLIPGSSDAGLAALNFAIRKSAHAGEYAVLALLGYRALAVSGIPRRSRQLAGALLLALAVASVDETGQSFTETRGGSPADVALDLAGAGGALALAYALREWPPVARWLPAAAARGEG